MAQTTESDHTKPHNTTGSTSSAFESLTSKVGALLLNRVELMLLEAGSAKHTVWAGVILSLLGVLSVFMAALFALLLIILVAPESWRIGLLGGFTLFFMLFAFKNICPNFAFKSLNWQVSNSYSHSGWHLFALSEMN